MIDKNFETICEQQSCVPATALGAAPTLLVFWWFGDRKY